MENKPVAQEKKPEMITISRAEYDYLQKQNQWLLEQLLLLNKKTYGTLSERTTEEVHEQMRMLFNEAEVYVDEEKKAEAAVPAIEVRAHSRKRKSGNVRDILPDDIEVVEVEHTIPEDERTCTECGTVMEPIGTEVRETLELIPAKAVLHRDIYVLSERLSRDPISWSKDGLSRMAMLVVNEKNGRPLRSGDVRIRKDEEARKSFREDGYALYQAYAEKQADNVLHAKLDWSLLEKTTFHSGKVNGTYMLLKSMGSLKSLSDFAS